MTGVMIRLSRKWRGSSKTKRPGDKRKVFQRPPPDFIETWGPWRPPLPAAFFRDHLAHGTGGPWDNPLCLGLFLSHLCGIVQGFPHDGTTEPEQWGGRGATNSHAFPEAFV